MAVQHASYAGVRTLWRPTSPSSTPWGKEPVPAKRGDGREWRFCDNGMAATVANRGTPTTERPARPSRNTSTTPSPRGKHGPSPRLPYTVDLPCPRCRGAPQPRNRPDHGPHQGHGAPSRAPSALPGPHRCLRRRRQCERRLRLSAHGHRCTAPVHVCVGGHRSKPFLPERTHATPEVENVPTMLTTPTDGR